MPVLPTFDPQGQPGDIAKAGMDAFVTSRNLMERAAQNRRQEEELQMRRDQFEVTLPVLRAQAQAQIATAGASLADARSRAEMEAKFAVDHVAAQDELNAIVSGAYAEAMPEGELDAEQLKAFNLQAQEQKDARLAQWMTKYSYLAQVPAGKDLYQQADTERGNLAKLRLGAMTMDALMARTQVTTAGGIKRAEITAAKPTTEERWFAQRQAAMEAGDTEAFQLYDNLLKRKQAAPANTEAGMAQILTRLDEVKNDPNSTPEEIALWTKRAQTAAAGPGLNFLFGGAGGSAPVPHAAAGEAKPVPPAVPAAQIPAKLYQTSPGQPPTLAPSVKTPQDVISAVQQMVDDGVIAPEQAREMLIRLGFKPKK